jgi:hypothetical protein
MLLSASIFNVNQKSNKFYFQIKQSARYHLPVLPGCREVGEQQPDALITLDAVGKQHRYVVGTFFRADFQLNVRLTAIENKRCEGYRFGGGWREARGKMQGFHSFCVLLTQYKWLKFYETNILRKIYVKSQIPRI